MLSVYDHNILFVDVSCTGIRNCMPMFVHDSSYIHAHSGVLRERESKFVRVFVCRYALNVEAIFSQPAAASSFISTTIRLLRFVVLFGCSNICISLSADMPSYMCVFVWVYLRSVSAIPWKTEILWYNAPWKFTKLINVLLYYAQRLLLRNLLAANGFDAFRNCPSKF